MPIKTVNPFRDPLEHMRPEVNRYLTLLKEGLESGDLPLLYGPAMEQLPGRWRQHFGDLMGETPQKLVLEIGSHFGEVILKMAADHPDTALIGMDITFKRVVKVAQKAQQHGLRNLVSVLCNAKALDQVFADGELDGIFIFFPDPWAQKKRQLKNRLVQPDFVQVLQRKLKPGGFFWFKSDCEPYYAAVCEAFQSQLWEADQERQGIPSEIYTSRFERLFREQGLPCHEFCWVSRGPIRTDL
jgi:tRNA (guanine-N7-)-methyltransferase